MARTCYDNMEAELEALRRSQRPPAAIPLQLPLPEPVLRPEPSQEAERPSPDEPQRGVVIIQVWGDEPEPE